MLRRLTDIAASNKFFYVVIAVFTVSCLWIAVSSTYPLAFDEEVHYGMTQIYASQPLPWAVEQTPSANAYGSITTDPSFLYYLLLSVPYRLVHLITDSQTAIITVLRIINIVMVVAALFMYRRLFDMMGLRRPMSHVLLALFTLIPVLPLLAGQINYDNLLLLILPVLFVAAIRIKRSVQDGKLSLKAVTLAALLIIYGSIVKYAFLPIAVAMAAYIAVVIWKGARQNPKLIPNIRKSLQKVGRPALAGAVVLIVIGSGLFAQRYGRNIAVYHDPVPDCGAVLSVEDCKAWGPWRRDYNLALNKHPDQTVRNVAYYTGTHWSWGMWNRLFFTLAGPENSYATRQRLPVISYSFIILGAVGILAALITVKNWARRYPGVGLIVLAGGIYTVILISQQYGLYFKTGQPVAINGRYLLPFLPLFGAIIAVGYSQLLDTLKAKAAMPLVGLLAILLFTQGGGITTYLIRSESNWLYQNQAIQATAHDLKTVSKFLVIGD